MRQMQDEPDTLFEAICRLDDLADWLATDYPEEAQRLRALSFDLKGYVLIALPDPDVGDGRP